MRSILYIPLILIVAAGGAFALWRAFLIESDAMSEAAFLECLERDGSTVTDTRPNVCTASDGTVFIEEVSNLKAKENLVRNVSVAPNQKVKSPLIVTGEARGYWSFEASFPVRLFDGNGKEMEVVPATMLTDWMTEDFVPFTATLRFAKPETSVGILVLQKDNPSGLPEHEDEVRIQVTF